jgi:8-amino-7-oxononanoate synthase
MVLEGRSVRSSFTDDLDRLASRNLKRSLRTVEGHSAARLQIDGRSFLNFSSNDYLGASRHPRVRQAVMNAFDRWGAGATASRLISGNTELHQAFEKRLARWLGAERALLFPSGYMANLGVITALVGAGDAVVVDRLSHASLVDAIRLSGARVFVYKHADLVQAEKALRRSKGYRRRLLVTDSLFSMDGDFAPIGELAALAKKFDAVSVLDEAHALGVWGPEGRGWAAAQSTHWEVRIGTLSKSLGSQGGFIAASDEIAELLINRARSFIYTTGLSPLCVAAASEALSWIQEDAAPREKVKKLSARLRDGLVALGWNVLGSQSQIAPIFLGSVENALEVSRRLYDAGIYAPAIRPPTVHPGECRLRFSVTTEHEERDVECLLRALHDLPSPPAGEGARRAGEGINAL